MIAEYTIPSLSKPPLLALGLQTRVQLFPARHAWNRNHESPPGIAKEIRRYPAVIGQDRIFPPKGGPTSRRQRLEGSFEDLLDRAKIHDFWFHDLRHTFASWYTMNGDELYELAKLLGHANIKMTERYAKLGRAHITQNRQHGQGDMEHVG